MKDAMALMGAIAFVLIGYLVWLALLNDATLEEMFARTIDYLSTPIR